MCILTLELLNIDCHSNSRRRLARCFPPEIAVRRVPKPQGGGAVEGLGLLSKPEVGRSYGAGPGKAPLGEGGPGTGRAGLLSLF